jgi:hypothetical protein
VNNVAPDVVREWGVVLAWGNVIGVGSKHRSRCMSAQAVSNHKTFSHMAASWNVNESTGVWAPNGSNVARVSWSRRPS